MYPFFLPTYKSLFSDIVVLQHAINIKLQQSCLSYTTVLLQNTKYSVAIQCSVGIDHFDIETFSKKKKQVPTYLTTDLVEYTKNNGVKKQDLIVSLFSKARHKIAQIKAKEKLKRNIFCSVENSIDLVTNYLRHQKKACQQNKNQFCGQQCCDKVLYRRRVTPQQKNCNVE